MTQFFNFLGEIEEKISYCFKNKNFLLNAFVHRSYLNEHPESGLYHNERLEFLGDSVLGLIVADYLYLKLPDRPEGELSDLRSRLVDASACMSYMKAIDVDAYMLLGKGEKVNTGRGRDSILADLFEALLGAIYLDAGIEAARAFFFGRFETQIGEILVKPMRNFKAELQDYSQRKCQEVPRYELINESGPSHSRFFCVGVWVDGEKLGEGNGSSKKQAQAAAAEAALKKLEDR